MPHNSQQPNKAEHHLPQQSVKYKHPVVKNNKNLLPLAKREGHFSLPVGFERTKILTAQTLRP